MSTTPSAREYEPQRSESSLGDLVTEMTDELSTLFRKEIELAKTEAREEVGHAGKAAALFGGAGLAGWLALLFLSLASCMADRPSHEHRGRLCHRRCRLDHRGPCPAERSAKAARQCSRASGDQEIDQGGHGMGQSAEELRREIDVTRGELGETLDAIGDRVSPGRMLERRKNRMARAVHTARVRVMGTADAMGDAAGSATETLGNAPDAAREQTQGSPLAAGAVAFGVGVLLASIFPATETEKEAADHLADKVEPLKQEMRAAGQEIAEHLREPAREALDEVKQAAAGSTEALKSTAKDVAAATGDATSQAAAEVRSELST